MSVRAAASPRHRPCPCHASNGYRTRSNHSPGTAPARGLSRLSSARLYTRRRSRGVMRSLGWNDSCSVTPAARLLPRAGLGRTEHWKERGEDKSQRTVWGARTCCPRGPDPERADQLPTSMPSGELPPRTRSNRSGLWLFQKEEPMGAGGLVQ